MKNKGRIPMIAQSRTLVSLPVATCLLAGLLLSGCALGQGEPYPQRRPTRPPVVETLSSGERVVIVQRGETLYGLSRRVNVPMRDLIDLNDIRSPYTLRVGKSCVCRADRQPRSSRRPPLAKPWAACAVRNP